MAVFEQRGGTSGGTYASYFTGRLTVNEISYDITANTSYCYYKLELLSGSSGRFSGYTASWSITIDGTVRSSGSGSYTLNVHNSSLLLGEGYVTIGHNTDGTKSMNCSAILDFQSGSYSPGDFTPNGSMTLTTIPRASAITATDANIGSSTSININKASSSFTSTVTYSFGSLSGTLLNKSADVNIGWGIPLEFFTQIPNANSGTVTLICQTYNGNTLIGTKTTTFTVRVPTDGIYNSTPTIDTASAIDINPVTLALTGNNKRLVTYISNVQVDVSGSCLNYATFKSLKSNGEEMTTTTSTSSGTTTVSGEIVHLEPELPNFTIILEDQRNLSSQRILSEENGDFVIIPYTPLTVSVDAERVAPASNSCLLSFSGVFYNGYFDVNNTNFNDLIIKWRYKESIGDWITTGADDTTDGWRNLTLNTDYEYTTGQNAFSSIGDITLADYFDYQKNYIIEINFSDTASSYSVQKTLPQGIPVHDEGVDRDGNNYFNVNGEYYKNNEKLVRNDIMMLIKNTNQSFVMNDSPRQITMDNYMVVGDKLTFTNSSVKIGAGVSYIKVTGLAWGDVSSGSGYKWLTAMRKRGTTSDIISTAITPAGSQGWDSPALPVAMIDVQENDEISLWIAFAGNGDANVHAGIYKGSTYLTVEVVE